MTTTISETRKQGEEMIRRADEVERLEQRAAALKTEIADAEKSVAKSRKQLDTLDSAKMDCKKIIRDALRQREDIFSDVPASAKRAKVLEEALAALLGGDAHQSAYLLSRGWKSAGFVTEPKVESKWTAPGTDGSRWTWAHAATREQAAIDLRSDLGAATRLKAAIA